MQIEKPQINDCFRVWRVLWKFRILIICNFVVIHMWKFWFSKKVAYFLTRSMVFSVSSKQSLLRLNNFKTIEAMNVKFSRFVIYVEAIIYLVLYNLHDRTFNCRRLLLKNCQKLLSPKYCPWLYIHIHTHTHTHTYIHISCSS